MATFIHGIAASQNIDSSGECINIAGMDISSLEKDGVFNYEHDSAKAPDKDGQTVEFQVKLPSNVVGKILKARKILSEEDCEDEHQKYFWDKIKTPYLYVMGELFDDFTDAAKDVAGKFRYDASKKGLQERNVMNFSVEGGKLDRKNMEILKSIARKVTLTVTPCNKAAIAEMVPAPRNDANDVNALFKTEAVEIELFSPNKELVEFLAKKEMEKGNSLDGGAPTSSMLCGEKLQKDQPILHPPAGAKAPSGKVAAPKESKRMVGMSSMRTTGSMGSMSSMSSMGSMSGGLSKALPGEPSAPKVPNQPAAKLPAPKGWSAAASKGPGGTSLTFTHTGNSFAQVGVHPEGGAFHVKQAGKTLSSHKDPRSAINAAATHIGSLGRNNPGNVMHNRSSAISSGQKFGIAKSMDAGSGMAAPGALVQGAALASESLSGKKVSSKSRWMARAEEEYASWDKKEHFRSFMQKKLPHLAMGEIDAIGKTMALNKAMKAEKTLAKMLGGETFQGSYTPKSEKNCKDCKPICKSDCGSGCECHGPMNKTTDIMMASEKNKK